MFTNQRTHQKNPARATVETLVWDMTIGSGDVPDDPVMKPKHYTRLEKLMNRSLTDEERRWAAAKFRECVQCFFQP